MGSNYKVLMEKARKTNKRRDKVDRKFFFAAVPDVPVEAQIRTAMSAIRCGMEINNFGVVAEAQAMLEVAHEKITGKKYFA